MEDAMNDHADAFIATIDARVSDILERCTRCGKCVEVCPTAAPAGIDTSEPAVAQHWKPVELEMTHDIHTFTSGWNELLASWARMTGVADNMHPAADAGFDARMKLDRLTLREGGNAMSATSLDDAMALILARPTGRINVRGANGSGKSTLLTILKAAVKTRAYYWPTADRMAFQFSRGQDEVETDEDGDPLPKKAGFSSGERQLRALQEIVFHTGAAIYLLDEWDANLDPNNRAAADALVEQLAERARVVEISHRDRM
jgi:ferredoxin